MRLQKVQDCHSNSITLWNTVVILLLQFLLICSTWNCSTCSGLVSSLSHANHVLNRMSSVPERQTGRQQSFPAGPSLPLQTLHTHPWHNPSPLTPFNTPHPTLLWTTALTQNGLKMTLFSHFPFFFTLSLFFPCRMKGLPDTHSMRIPFRPGHTGSLCAAQRGGGGTAGWEVVEESRGGRESTQYRGRNGGIKKGGGKKRAKCKSCEAHEN